MPASRQVDAIKQQANRQVVFLLHKATNFLGQGWRILLDALAATS
jgi:hypothetical protein